MNTVSYRSSIDLLTRRANHLHRYIVTGFAKPAPEIGRGLFCIGPFPADVDGPMCLSETHLDTASKKMSGKEIADDVGTVRRVSKKKV